MRSVTKTLFFTERNLTDNKWWNCFKDWTVGYIQVLVYRNSTCGMQYFRFFVHFPQLGTYTMGTGYILVLTEASECANFRGLMMRVMDMHYSEFHKTHVTTAINRRKRCFCIHICIIHIVSVGNYCNAYYLSISNTLIGMGHRILTVMWH